MIVPDCPLILDCLDHRVHYNPGIGSLQPIPLRSKISREMSVIPMWEDRVSHTDELINATLRATDPKLAVQRYLRREDDVLWVEEDSYHLTDFRRVLLVGFGKASAAMAETAECILGDFITGGLVLTKYGYSRPIGRIKVMEAGHPVPDEAGVAATHHLLEFVGLTTPEDLIILLISGGSSALLTMPAEGVSLAELQGINLDLLHSGATISQINTVRKHLSQVKGGNLARRFFPARSAALVLSDVVGNDLDVIASGPMSPDPTTFDAAWETIDTLGLQGNLSKGVNTHLRRGMRGEVQETPKRTDPVFEKVQTVIVGDNRSAVNAAIKWAGTLGFDARLLRTSMRGEARVVGRDIVVHDLAEISIGRQPTARPLLFALGGETTVTVRGDGKGGRNQELALAAAITMSDIGLGRTRLVCFATDGGDGVTEAAGAVADSDTVIRAARLGLDAKEHLARNDSFHFFDALGDLITTGPTGTNVNDLVAAFLYG